jgi:hypothetical protein
VFTAVVPPGASSIDFPAAPGSGVVLLQAELFYEIKNPLRVLPVVGTLPRYLVSIENAAHSVPVTLNPYVTSSRIPILAYRGRPVRLTWNAFSLLPGASIHVSRVKLSFFSVVQENVPWLESLYSQQTGVNPE